VTEYEVTEYEVTEYEVTEWRFLLSNLTHFITKKWRELQRLLRFSELFVWFEEEFETPLQA
jgi:hypothetical protein